MVIADAMTCDCHSYDCVPVNPVDTAPDLVPDAAPFGDPASGCRSLVAIAATVSRLIGGAARPVQEHIIDAAIHTGLMWTCLCTAPNRLDAAQCCSCGKARLWTRDTIPSPCVSGPPLEGLRTELKDWFDKRPHDRRPAAVAFRITFECSDQPAWATCGAALHYTDYVDGQLYHEDFKRTRVAEALDRLCDADTPTTGDTLRVVVPV